MFSSEVVPALSLSLRRGTEQTRRRTACPRRRHRTPPNIAARARTRLPERPPSSPTTVAARSLAAPSSRASRARSASSSPSDDSPTDAATVPVTVPVTVPSTDARESRMMTGASFTASVVGGVAASVSVVVAPTANLAADATSSSSLSESLTALCRIAAAAAHAGLSYPPVANGSSLAGPLEETTRGAASGRAGSRRRDGDAVAADDGDERDGASTRARRVASIDRPPTPPNAAARSARVRGSDDDAAAEGTTPTPATGSGEREATETAATVDGEPFAVAATRSRPP
jgi:hypothetical protein